MNIEKRKRNEKKFKSWEELNDGGRRYWYTVIGRSRWKAVYVKEVNKNEETVRFYQNIYNESGKLVETHEKYPIDRGHKKIE